MLVLQKDQELNGEIGKLLTTEGNNRTVKGIYPYIHIYTHPFRNHW